MGLSTKAVGNRRLELVGWDAISGDSTVDVPGAGQDCTCRSGTRRGR